MQGIDTGTHSWVRHTGCIDDRLPYMLLVFVCAGAPPETVTCCHREGGGEGKRFVTKKKNVLCEKTCLKNMQFYNIS